MAKKHHDISRKELKEPDAFFESVGKLNRYWHEHRNTVIAAATAVVVVFGGGVAWTAHVRSATASTAATFMRAADAIEAKSFASAQASLDNVIDSGRRPYDYLAKLYEADLLARDGKYQEALGAYDDVAAAAGADYVRQIALVGKAYSLEMSDDMNSAVHAYEEAGQLAGPYREQALRGQLRTALSVQDKPLARAAIEAILEHYPDADDVDVLSQQLSVLGKQADS